MAAGALNGDEKTAAAEGLGDDDFVAGTVQNDVRSDAGFEFGLLVKVPHAAQVTIALFADIGCKKQIAGQGHARGQESGGKCQQSSNSGPVVACSRGNQA